MAKNLDWDNLGFAYREIDYRVVARYTEGAWSDLQIITDPSVHMSECAAVLQYSQTVFEGLKAYRTEDGRLVTFRPDMNAQRLMDSADRLVMPKVPEEMFVKAVDMLVKANADWVPPYGTGGTLYIRPFIFGNGPTISIHPAPEFEFRVIGMPVGPYFKNGMKPIVIKVSDRDRAAAHGTGDIKAGLNYAMSLYPGEQAVAEGFAENMYLDSATRTYVEETGGANFLFVTKDGTIVTPKSDSILPSITRRSLMYVAEHILGMKVEHRPVSFEEVSEFAEAGVCGTAAVICPIGKINDHGKEICIPSGMDAAGPVIQKLYDTLTGIQMGTIEGPEGWVHEVK